MGLRGFFVLLLWINGCLMAQVVINEVDADQENTDSAEFLELYGPPNTPLDGMALVFFNGSGDVSYAAFDLDGHSLNGLGFFVLCANDATTANCDLDVSPETNLIQNGADAVALYNADATDFPNGTSVTNVNLVDALVYDTNDGDDSGLLSVLTPGQGQINEGGGAGSTVDANARVPDGGTALNTSSYTQQAPTPGTSNGGAAVIVINEVDADTPGPDQAEFIELFGTGGASLDGLVLVLFDGDSDTSYGAFDLDGHSLSSSGFFTICGDSGNLVNCDLDISPDSDFLKNGADAVALYTADGTDFPNGTAVTDSNLVDALVYDTGQADDAGLLSVLTPGGSQIDEDGNGSSETESSSRNPDGGLPLDTGSYEPLPPTPGSSNPLGPVSTVVINEFVLNHSGPDQYEYIEVHGEDSTDYSHLTLVHLEGVAAENPGIIQNAFTVGTTDASGYWNTGFGDDFFANSTLSLLLVEGFAGTTGTDLDTNDDGVLDTAPWTTVLDSVAVDEQNPGDLVYGNPVLTPGFDGNAFLPGGASRIPDGQDTNLNSDWLRNNFDGAGLPGLDGTLAAGEAANTPLGENSTAQPPPPLKAVINEVVADHTGSDTHEYVELLGQSGVDYSPLRLLLIDGVTNPGQVLDIFQPGLADTGGYWSTGFLADQLPNATITYVLVEDFTGMMDDDLDGDDNGQFDSQPWWRILDDVTLQFDPADTAYSSTVLGDGFDRGGVVPGGASRIPNGLDSDMNSDWRRNDFDGEGLPGFTGNLKAGEAINTPGIHNATLSSGGNDAVINEFVFNHTGGDDHEYVEVAASADTNYSHLWLLVLEGDNVENPGQVTGLAQVGETGAEGYWTTGFLDNAFENDSQSLLLVEGFSGALGADLDTNDDGILDTTPWTTLVDDVAVSDGDGGDLFYAATTLIPNFDGIVFTVGGASRLPDGTDTDQVADWKRNDFSGEGLPGFDGDLQAAEAVNTPGAENSDQLPPGTNAQLSEFVADHTGADQFEFVEIFGDPQTSYHTTTVLVINGDLESNPGTVAAAFLAGLTDSDGFWESAFQTDVLPNGSFSLLVVEDWAGMVSDDLDGDDDGNFDVNPWSVLQDDVAVDDGGAGDLAYSAVVLGTGFARGGTHPGGASRYPYGTDSESLSDWVRNDFEGAGLDSSFPELPQAGFAYNSPGTVNRVGLPEYYAGVDASDGSQLRSDLHELIDDHIYHPYTSSFTDTWDVLEMADEDPNNPANILSIYKNATYAKQGGGNDFYNREHSWPKSYGFPDDFNLAYPYTDFHHLRLADSSYNSQRSNIAFGTCHGGCNEATTDVNNGQGGGSGVYPGNSNWFTGSAGSGIYEVWHYRRGDVARGLLYLDVRYQGGVHGLTMEAEPNLELTDNTGLIAGTGINTTGTAYMGRLATLLQWHEDDPVDDLERRRNHIIYQFQGNRNPFVDHPEWVDCVFSGDCPTSVLSPCVLGLIAQWLTGPSPCGGGPTLSVFDYVALVNGTCVCPVR